jgi:hypothetical protein
MAPLLSSKRGISNGNFWVPKRGYAGDPLCHQRPPPDESAGQDRAAAAAQRDARAPPTPHVLRLVMGGPQTVCDEPGQKETGGSGAKNKGKGAAAARAEHKRAPRHPFLSLCSSASACAPVPLTALHSQSLCLPCLSLHASARRSGGCEEELITSSAASSVQ